MAEFEVDAGRDVRNGPTGTSAQVDGDVRPAELEVPQGAVEAVLDTRWRGPDRPFAAHSGHNFDGGCAVCSGDVPAVLAVAAPYIAAAALRQAAEDLWDRMDGETLAGVYRKWLVHRADQLDNRPEPTGEVAADV